MYELSYEFIFIDLIKTELNLSKVLELFGLTSNTTDIELKVLELHVFE